MFKWEMLLQILSFASAFFPVVWFVRSRKFSCCLLNVFCTSSGLSVYVVRKDRLIEPHTFIQLQVIQLHHFCYNSAINSVGHSPPPNLIGGAPD